MSVEAGIELDLLVESGESIAPRCEHSQHDERAEWHEDGDEHYVLMNFAPCGHGVNNRVIVVCAKWLATSDVVRCRECGVEYRIYDFMTDLGPVSNYTS